ncbi:MAG: quinone oxidoreductase, partial [Acidobacteriota bacterium]
MKAIRVHQAGGPETLLFEEVPTPEPGSDEVLVKTEAIGVNFIDIYFRQGLYPGTFPLTPGLEAAGTVIAMGPDVSEVGPGDRVAYSSVMGSYAEQTLVPSDQLIKIPENLDCETTAATLMQGMTAHYLSHSTYPMVSGETALVHAAAGGVGLLLVQMAKMCGARVIGTVSNLEKAELAREAGADEVILYTETDFEEQVQRLTDSQGVDVVYESVGKDTFDQSLNCLKKRGYLVLFGQSSGPVPPVDPQILNAKGSLFLTRPSIFHYNDTREALVTRAGEVLSWVAEGRLKVRVGERFALSEACQAHRALEARQTTGKVLLIP